MAEPGLDLTQLTPASNKSVAYEALGLVSAILETLSLLEFAALPGWLSWVRIFIQRASPSYVMSPGSG